MTVRFRKTKKIAPGVKVNLTKNGVGVTVGGKVARTSISPKGDVRVSASVPGSGVSVSKKVGSIGSSEVGRSAERASQAAESQGQQKKRKTWLWVLGWLFIFPVPLTIIMFKNESINKWIRIGIIVAAWLLYAAIGFASDGVRSPADSANPSSGAEIEGQSTNVEPNDLGNDAVGNEYAVDRVVNDLVISYNAISESPIGSTLA